MVDKKRYSDIDINFKPHPVTKDVVKRYDDSAIKQSIINLVSLNFYDKWNPEIGSNVNSLLFEPNTPLTAITLKTAIEQTINNFEPRVELIEVSVFARQNNFDVTIEFNIVNVENPVTINFLLKRTR
jgi:phage baseplate assembly protein W